MSGLTVDNPSYFQDALISSRMKPGDVVKLRDINGPYTGQFISLIAGTGASPVIIQPYGSEQPIIDGSIDFRGDNVEVHDLEVKYSGWTTRESQQAGSNPTDINSQYGFWGTGDNVSVYDCRIHDLPRTFFPGIGGDIVGCHIYHIGWVGTDRGHGHSIYSQNPAPSGTQKRYAYNICHDNFGKRIVIYDELAALDNYLVEYNVLFQKDTICSKAYQTNLLHGGQVQTADNAIHQYNLTYGRDISPVNYGYVVGFTDLSLIGNYYSEGCDKYNCSLTEEADNTYGTVGDQVFVYPYKTDLGYVTIFNESQLDNVSVDVSSVLGVGDDYELANAQDDLVDIQTGTVAGDGTISVNMEAANRSVAVPTQWTAPTKTFPEFGCFILRIA